MAVENGRQELDAELEPLRRRVEAELARFVRQPADCPPRLQEAMEYSLLAGGKRLRPLLVLLACEACGGNVDAALPAACALEMVHTYSLIHDDLPAMDDDDLRRGRPTCHKVFGEALAILAGDALLTLAFEVIATHVVPSDVAAACCADLASAAGACGMVGGQVADLEAEGRFVGAAGGAAGQGGRGAEGQRGRREAGPRDGVTERRSDGETEGRSDGGAEGQRDGEIEGDAGTTAGGCIHSAVSSPALPIKGDPSVTPSLRPSVSPSHHLAAPLSPCPPAPSDDRSFALVALEAVHLRKTGRLLRSALTLGARIAQAAPALRDALDVYGKCVGLAFQIADDLLDVCGDQTRMGKGVRKDASHGKLTYPALLGVEASREKARGLVKEACRSIAPLGDRGRRLEALAHFVLERDH